MSINRFEIMGSYVMKNRMISLIIVAMMILVISGCTTQVDGSSGTAPDAVQIEDDETEQIYDDIAAENIHHVNISGNARSIIIRQGENENFEFYNGDLDTNHTYKVLCDENGDTIDINILMENGENDNNILGSFIIDIPQKEFEKIEVTGEFIHISLNTINSDVLIHANNSFVNLDLEADQLEHNITLEGSESNVFRGVSVYLDKFPDNVRWELNVIQGGTINDPQSILKENILESSDSGNPDISINNAEEINVYRID